MTGSLFAIQLAVFFLLGCGIGYFFRSAKAKTQKSNDGNRAEVYKSVIEAVPGMVSIFSAELKYQLVNQFVVSQMGIPEDQILGRELGFRNSTVFTETIQTFLRSEEASTLTKMQFECPNGPRWFVVGLSKLPEGRLAVVSIDIDDHVRAQEEVVTQRSLAEHNARMAAMGDLAAGIAHEVNNPIAVITAKSEQTIRKMQVSGQTQFVPDLEKIKNMGFRIANIVRGLKNLSRNGDGDPFTQSRLVDIVRDITAILDEKLRAYQISLQINIPEAQLINCRSTQIGQLIMNLVANSFDAIRDVPDSWIRVESKIIPGYVEISVTDSGFGIPPELRQKIMSPFFTTKPAGVGTGLGLSISKRIALDHGGDFFYDETSVNTRFVLKIPVKQTATQIAA